MLDKSVKKDEWLVRLRQAHDRVKDHPYRLALSYRYVRDYKNALYDLSEVWAEYIYYGDHSTTEEEKKFYQFGRWIHNYRARLQMYYPDTFPESLLDYYEQMLQVTHTYLDTGNMDVMYVLDSCINKQGEKVWVSEKYEWTTSESIGIESAILPRYLPKKHKLIADEKTIYDVINSGYNLYKESQEQRDEWCAFWTRETKPIIDKLNETNYDRFTHSVAASVIYTPADEA